MAENILLTGATGTIGKSLLGFFADRGDVKTHALVRDEKVAAGIQAAGITALVGTFENGEQLVPKLEGITEAVLITPSDVRADHFANTFIDAAARAGVNKIIRISAVKASADGPTHNTRLHAASEDYLRQSGLDYTILRPNFFMQNLLMALPSIQSDGQFSFAMGGAHLGMIDTRDVARCAAACVGCNAHNGQTYELTGPHSVSWAMVAAQLARQMGREVECLDQTPQEQFERFRGFGMDPWMCAVIRDYAQAYRDGFGDFTTDCVSRITGRQATGIGEFISGIFLPLLNGHGE